jgi:hypothetical protein
MRIWKLAVLLAGVAGVIGLFTPLIDYRSTDSPAAPAAGGR